MARFQAPGGYQQADSVVLPAGVDGHIDDRDQGNRHDCFDRLRERVRGIAGHDEKIGARLLESPRHCGQRSARVLTALEYCGLATRDARILVDE